MPKRKGNVKIKYIKHRDIYYKTNTYTIFTHTLLPIPKHTNVYLNFKQLYAPFIRMAKRKTNIFLSWKPSQ